MAWLGHRHNTQQSPLGQGKTLSTFPAYSVNARMASTPGSETRAMHKRKTKTDILPEESEPGPEVPLSVDCETAQTVLQTQTRPELDASCGGAKSRLDLTTMSCACLLRDVARGSGHK